MTDYLLHSEEAIMQNRFQFNPVIDISLFMGLLMVCILDSLMHSGRRAYNK